MLEVSCLFTNSLVNTKYINTSKMYNSFIIWTPFYLKNVHFSMSRRLVDFQNSNTYSQVICSMFCVVLHTFIFLIRTSSFEPESRLFLMPTAVMTSSRGYINSFDSTCFENTHLVRLAGHNFEIHPQVYDSQTCWLITRLVFPIQLFL